jgi:hypothetical protein
LYVARNHVSRGALMGTVMSDINHAANSINPFKGITDWSTNHSLNYIPGVGKPLAQLANWGDSHPAQVGAAIGAASGGEALLAGDGAAAGAGGATASAGGLGAAGGATASAGGLGAAGGATASAGASGSFLGGMTAAQEAQLGLSAVSLAKTAMTPAPSLAAPAPVSQLPQGPESQGASAAQAMMGGAGQAGGAPGVAQTLLTGAGGVDPSTIGLGKNTLLGS